MFTTTPDRGSDLIKHCGYTREFGCEIIDRTIHVFGRPHPTTGTGMNYNDNKPYILKKTNLVKQDNLIIL
jgi:hypothetical protein